MRFYENRLRELEAAAGRPEGSVRLMAVTKTVPPEKVNAALRAGAALVGENRVQELMAKKNQYNCAKSQIHFIGHLQTNKIRDIMNSVSCVQSVDSLRLARALSAAAEKAGVRMDCLLEVNIGMEESKSGFSPEGVLGAAREIAAMPFLTPPRADDRSAGCRVSRARRPVFSPDAGALPFPQRGPPSPGPR